MVKSTSVYGGEKHCDITHEPSKTKIETDAPKDNQGKGERFSPTDLVGAALGSCILTTIAIMCERDGLDMKGATAQVEKEMSSTPRRIAKLAVHIHFPQNVAPEMRKKIEQIAHACPVHKSLHPDVQMPIEFTYGA